MGLVPENELSRRLGVEINLMTNGPVVDSSMMTNIDGVFATGNVLHVHDLVDFVTEESKRTGKYVVDYLNHKRAEKQISIKPGSNIRYVNPTKCMPDRDNKLYMRSMIVKNGAELNVTAGDDVIFTKKLRHIHPAEMIDINLGPDELQKAVSSDSPLEVSIK